MGYYIQPCEAAILQVWVTGTLSGTMDITSYVHCLRVYESLCKEYITFQVIAYDNNNILENAGITAGCSIGFSFYAPPNQYVYGTAGGSYGGGYGAVQVLKIKGEPAPDTLKYSIYTIDGIGSVFYADQRQTAFDIAYHDVIGTDEIQKIWNQYLSSADSLSIKTPSMGIIGSKDNPGTKPGQHPLTAIHNIMREMVSATNSQLSNWLLYKNRTGVKLQQLPDMFKGIGPSGALPPAPGGSTNDMARGQQEYFVQKETWGANNPDGTGGFNDRDLYHAVIGVQAEARQGSGSGGVASGINISSAVATRQFVQDIASGNIISQPLAALIPNIGSLFSSISGGGLGAGLAGNQITNSRIWPNATAPFIKTPGELGYSAAAKDAPQLVMKVPIQTGLNVTVGLGIFAYLIPPIGLQGGTNQDKLTGSWLVTDLCHELFTDGRQRSCTTVMQLNQGVSGSLISP